MLHPLPLATRPRSDILAFSTIRHIMGLSISFACVLGETMSTQSDLLVQTLLVLSTVVIALGLIVLTAIWHFRRSSMILRRWADENGYELLESRLNWLNQGPFFWTSSSGQTVYYVRVVNRSDGRLRQGWVRCGGFWGGLFDARAEVRWDEPQ